MSDQVSWLIVEPGWEVEDAEGKRLGNVKNVLGDQENDIFNGLAVSPGLLKPTKYVPAETVARIEEGCVRLSITRSRFEQLGEHDETEEG
jgi:hypothetical protein